eukprot:CAMPEP_0177498832 /NCGR_PEP_ID=MMETSP0369-20130122/35801_1 /TAXON_ID=447022 ORGANISM="Scrippsiella hangoei-like, Strain SHHI-4" /NCGR_SAMPLE_ID=MMETSP0369 /ASSEMBLY_ACC=CAM_ASM_000364 /LENGTH=49 /DNA_ID= /DNA_START= /DNA_END= /DNA_ORIENTATION=
MLPICQRCCRSRSRSFKFAEYIVSSSGIEADALTGRLSVESRARCWGCG